MKLLIAVALTLSLGGCSIVAAGSTESAPPSGVPVSSPTAAAEEPGAKSPQEQTLVDGVSRMPNAFESIIIHESGDELKDGAAALLAKRYELVGDGKYAEACELYSAEFAVWFAKLAEVPEASCVEAHIAAIATAELYLKRLEEQNRPGMTPFFYLPTSVEIHADLIRPDRVTRAFFPPGTVVTTDPREFDDGPWWDGPKMPGWMTGLKYAAHDDDGVWRMVMPTEY